jgi:hypothetical protein
MKDNPSAAKCPVCGAKPALGSPRCATHNDAYVRNELAARAEMRAHFARGPADGLVSEHRAREDAEALIWRDLERQFLGEEIRAYDAAQDTSRGMLDLIEQNQAQQHADETDELLEGWGREGRAKLGFGWKDS